MLTLQCHPKFFLYQLNSARCDTYQKERQLQQVQHEKSDAAWKS